MNKAVIFIILAVSGTILVYSGYLLGRPSKAEITAICAPYEAAAVERANAFAIAEGMKRARAALEESNKLLEAYEKEEKEAISGTSCRVDNPVVIDERLCRAACEAYAGLTALHPTAADNTMRTAGEPAETWHE